MLNKWPERTRREEAHYGHPGRVGCLIVFYLFSGAVSLLTLGMPAWDVIFHRQPSMEWPSLVRWILVVPETLFSLIAGASLCFRRPDSWRRAFISLRILLYCSG